MRQPAGANPLLWCVLLCVFAAEASAGSLGGALELQARSFFKQDRDRNSASVALKPTVFQSWNHRNTRLEGELFYRLDSLDDRRSHGDVRSLYLQHLGRDWEALVGVAQVRWGVTESRTLVDVINQADFVEDIAADAKLGQPMLALTWLQPIGSFDVFVMPYQRARTFPDANGQPRIGFDFAPEEARYASSAGQRHVDVAGRLRMRFGPLDLNLSVFDGTARDPDILPCLRRGSGFPGTADGPNCDLIKGTTLPEAPLANRLLDLFQRLGLVDDDFALFDRVLANIVLVPEYARLRQMGLEAQYIRGALALKLEAVARERGGRSTQAAVGGIEYALAGFFNSGWEVTALAEYLFDERRTLINSRSDNDLFLGTRINLNDIPGTVVEAGFFMDRSGTDQLMQIEASRRFGPHWRGALTARHFERVPTEPFLDFLRDESMVRLSLQRFF